MPPDEHVAPIRCPTGFGWYSRAMRTTIDAAGRLVVPKPLREALGLSPGQPVEIVLIDGRLEVEPAVTPMRLTRRGRGAVAVPERKLPRLTAEQVRATLERVRW